MRYYIVHFECNDVGNFLCPTNEHIYQLIIVSLYFKPDLNLKELLDELQLALEQFIQIRMPIIIGEDFNSRIGSFDDRVPSYYLSGTKLYLQRNFKDRM